MFAPIIIFAFNRLEVLKNAVSSLLQNKEAADCDLFIFVDGARENKRGEAEKVCAVQEYVKTIEGFKCVHYTFSEVNKGLAKSIIGGVSEILYKYGKAIVVEDDLYLSRSFLRFMNDMLNKYESDERIMQVSGYGCKLTRLGDYPYDAYINERAQCWSWATWKNRWDTVDWNVTDYETLSASPKLQKAFNQRGSDLFGMLKGCMEHKVDSWYIRFHYSMYKQCRYSITPVKSLVRNDGFGEEATHCKSYNRYKVDFEIEHLGEFRIPDHFEPCERIIINSVRYWKMLYRIYGKIATHLMRLQ